jgi:AhpD family alkylhydroperoxidase
LFAVAIAVRKGCDGCIASHARGVVRTGATESEVAEALGVAIAMNGGPASVYGPPASAAFRELAEAAAIRQGWTRGRLVTAAAVCVYDVSPLGHSDAGVPRRRPRGDRRGRRRLRSLIRTRRVMFPPRPNPTASTLSAVARLQASPPRR